MADYWLKLYTEVLEDAKMALLSDHLWRRFFELCLVAKRLNKDGLLPPAAEIAWTLRRPEDEIADDLEAMTADNLQLLVKDGDTYTIKSFAKRQARSTDAERKRQQRDRERRDQYGGGGSGGSDPDRAPDGPGKQTRAATAVKKQVQALPAEDRAWIERIEAGFGEEFTTPVLVKSALSIRAQFGEEKGWEAILFYAGKSYPMAACVVRALKALPNWKDYKPLPPSSGQPSRRRSKTGPPAPRKPYNIETALQCGMSIDDVRQKMAALGYKPDEIQQQLRAYV